MPSRRPLARRTVLAALSTSVVGCVGVLDGSGGGSPADVPSPAPRPDREITAEEFVLVVSVSADEEWIGPYIPSQEGVDPDPELAMLRPMVETPSGDRVGVDAETGEAVQEVAEASVQGAGRTRTVMILGHPRLEVTISGDALLRTIRAHGHRPETVPYDLRVLVDTEPYLERTEEGVIVHGRASHSVERTTDDEGPVLAHADVELAPWSIAAEPADEPLWALVDLEAPLDPAAIDLESVRFNDVPVVESARSEPIVQERDGRTVAAFAFPREEIADLLDPGPHEISVSGTVGNSVFVGMAPFDVEG